MLGDVSKTLDSGTRVQTTPIVQSYRDLRVWQRGMDLVAHCYHATKSFPDDERYGLTSQIRRSAVSIPSNIADLDCRPDALFDGLGQDRILGSLIAKSKGIRVPGCWDVFELTLRAIFGQQISVRAATTMLERLAANFGTSLQAGSQTEAAQRIAGNRSVPRQNAGRPDTHYICPARRLRILASSLSRCSSLVSAS